MLKSKSVFVIGAGASAEVDLPIGSGLKDTIAEMLTFEIDAVGRIVSDKGYDLLEKLRREYPDEINNLLAACRQIARGLIHAQSIDDFINNFQHDPRVAICGKLAISKAILDAERNSKLSFERVHLDSSINFSSVSQTWYPAFYNLITVGTTAEDLDAIFDNLTIICFNYDRCIEHYLVHALVAHWGMPVPRAMNLVQNLTIYRPYGSVGSYFGQFEDGAVTYGSKNYPPFTSTVSTLRTYTEKVADINDLEHMHDAINNSEMLVFLGMAFHPNNMNLLVDKRPNQRSVPKQVYATRLGLSESDINQVIISLNRVCTFAPHDEGKYPYLHFAGSHSNCAALFNEYRMAMRA